MSNPRQETVFATGTRIATPTDVPVNMHRHEAAKFVVDVTAVPGAPVKKIVTVDGGDSTGGTFTLSFDGVASGVIDFDEVAAALDTIVEAVAGVTTATVTGGTGRLKEVSTIDIGTSTGGSFTLTVDGETTGDIAFDAVAADMKTALELLSTVATVTVTGGGLTKEQATIDTGTSTGGDFTLTVDAQTTAAIPFDSLAAVVKTELELASTVDVVTVTGGPKQEVSSIDVGSSLNGTFTITVGANETAAIASNVTAAGLKTALELLASVSTVTVTGRGVPSDPWVVTFAELAVAAVSGDGALLYGGDSTLTVAETVAGAPAGTAWLATFDGPIGDLAVSGTGTGLTGGNSTLTVVETTTGIAAADFVATFDDPIKAIAVSGTGSLTGGDATLTVVETAIGSPATPWVITVDTPVQNYVVTGDGALLTGGIDTTLTIVDTQAGADGSATATVGVYYTDDASGKDVLLLESTALAAAGTVELDIGPEVPAVANLGATKYLPEVIVVKVAHDTADEVDYSISVHRLGQVSPA